MSVAGAEHRTFHLAPGVLDEPARACLLQGQCHALALALHEQTGWPIRAVVDEQDDIRHLVVEAPDGRLLDASGAHPRQAMAEAWEAEIAPLDAERARGLEAEGTWRAPALELARSMVAPALEYVDGARPALEPGPYEGPLRGGAPTQAQVLGPDGRFVSVRAGVIDAQVTALYRGRGQSGALAGALWLALGRQGRLTVVSDEEGEPAHVALELGDGRILDVEGARSAQEFTSAWPGERRYARRLSELEEELAEAFDPWPVADVAAAELLVDVLLERAGLARSASPPIAS